MSLENCNNLFLKENINFDRRIFYNFQQKKNHFFSNLNSNSIFLFGIFSITTHLMYHGFSLILVQMNAVAYCSGNLGRNL